MPVGAGGSRRKNLTVDSVSQRSIIQISNRDNLCLPRALVVGEAKIALQANDTPAMRAEWNVIRDSRRQLQHERAVKLCQDAGVLVPREGCGVRELRQFQHYFTARGTALVAYERDSLGNGEAPFFDGRSDTCTTIIFLLYSELHYDVIVNIFGAARAKFFCTFCNRGYSNIEDHKCRQLCSRCFVSPPCSENEALQKCASCNRNFFGDVCFRNHSAEGSYKTKNKRLCDVLQICGTCCKSVNRQRGKHECGKNWCRHCKSTHGYNQHCFIQPIKNDASAKKYLYVFYDLETMQEASYRGDESIKMHVPNVCVAQQVCTDCISSTDDISVAEWCPSCGVREHIFTEDPVGQLLELVVRDKTDFENIICIAHNARGYDAQFVLRRLVERKINCAPSIILNGQKILCIRYGRTKFIDSLSYFQMKLAALPATFGLGETTKKGCFPHLFNTSANAEYRGAIPDVHYYSPDTMSTSEREQFLRWHSEMRAANAVFDFRKEIVDYCRMDVSILRRACVAFRKIFLEVGDTDPFVVATTIASACSHLYRKKFLKPQSIGIVPRGGYSRADKHSQKAVEWLLQCEREIGREIVHAGRAREYRLREGFLVDGFLPSANPAEKPIVFEFQGCYTHGCPECFKNNRNKSNAWGRTFDALLESTRAKIAQIQQLGYETREIWECEFDRVKRENPEIAKYVSEHPLISKITLNPRDAFFGGRTENFVAVYDAKPGERILYTDICSLYPYICKRGRFPLGHPKVYVGEESDELTGGNLNNFSAIDGLVKCKVLPPRKLYQPLLPLRMHGKLLFALCRTCCEEMRQSDCCHPDASQREFSGTWVADELRKAIELGYTITEIFVIWQYSMTEFDPLTGEGGLFAGYIDTFLRLKQEASGFPAWCVDAESKARYIREYRENEGISLELDKIAKNPGLRTVAKLCLNSFWGKFGQRDNLKQTVIVKEREDLLKLLTAEDKEVLSLLLVNEEVMYTSWQYIDDAVESTPYTNVVIAAYTTTLARLKLYSYLEKLGKRTLYCDTDSCIFVCNDQNAQEYRPPLGSLLGDMTDELDEGTFITSFLSGGPKFYGFRTVNSRTGEVSEKCKVKGISLNFSNSLRINYPSIKSMIENYFESDEENECINLKFNSIKRLPDHTVVTREEVKSCSIVLKKRRYVTPGLSLPYGYKS
ncbi:uncharacterized protein LOC116417974 [Nasonia vitripennis]|uniref:DNA-directed DNA polymerase n=1 Tax=Nasonia vitripennis TaxID=7425 RepID=A0A7M7QN38_NASVI|nr:uncharacterized protein LOC116417974 [Nasonia vitripennis]